MDRQQQLHRVVTGGSQRALGGAITLFIAAWLAVGCATPSSDGSIATGTRALGSPDGGLPPPVVRAVMASTDPSCPPLHGGSWQGERLFPAASDVFGGETPDDWECPDGVHQGFVYCRYTWREAFPPGPGDRAEVVDGLWLDKPVVLGLASMEEVTGGAKSRLLEHAGGQTGALAALPDRHPAFPKVRVAVIDSALPSLEPGVPGSGETPHGRDVGLMIRSLACPDNDNGSPACAVEVSTHLALDMVQAPWGGAAVATNEAGNKTGGHLGTPGQVARALWEAVVAWQREAHDARLVINLSLGWEPGDPDLLMVEDAVRRVIGYARWKGAVVIAAAGNSPQGLSPPAGPMFPADWEYHPGPNCDGGPVAGYVPLVYAAGGVGTTGEALAGTRDNGRPALVAYGLQVPADLKFQVPGALGEPVFDSPVLSGTSVSAAVVSAVAAAVWYYNPGWTAAEVMEHVWQASMLLGPPADYCIGHPSGGTPPNPCREVRRVMLSRVLTGSPAVPDPAFGWQGALDAANAVPEAVRALASACSGACTPSICPDRDLPIDGGALLVVPQPGVVNCDVCGVNLWLGTVTLAVSPKLAGSGALVTDLALRLTPALGNEEVYKLNLPALGPGELAYVTGLKPLSPDYKRAEIVGRIQIPGKDAVAMSEEIHFER